MHPTGANKSLPQSSPFESGALKAVFSKINWRLIPLLLIAYMVAYLDRINVGYAQLQMKQTLPFDDAVYGLGAAIFFSGYFLFEVPSNLLLEKIGARKTLLRIMVLWGLAATAMMFVSTPLQFYVVRFLLGAFEAGFFPGVILYFTYWYPSVRRGQVIAIFMSATTIVSVIAGPMCGAILKYFDGFIGLHGWQWLFVVQGLPAIVLGFLVYLLLEDKPAHAAWLSRDEKTLLDDSLQHDVKDVESEPAVTFGQMLRDPKVYVLSFVYFLLLGATYTLVFWLPTLRFVALDSEYLSVGAAAGGIAPISCLGNVGPAVSPAISGFILRNTGDNIYSMYFVLALYLLAGTLLLLTIRPASTAGVPAAAPAH